MLPDFSVMGGYTENPEKPQNCGVGACSEQYGIHTSTQKKLISLNFIMGVVRTPALVKTVAFTVAVALQQYVYTIHKIT